MLYGAVLSGDIALYNEVIIGFKCVIAAINALPLKSRSEFPPFPHRPPPDAKCCIYIIFEYVILYVAIGKGLQRLHPISTPLNKMKFMGKPCNPLTVTTGYAKGYIQ